MNARAIVGLLAALAVAGCGTASPPATGAASSLSNTPSASASASPSTSSASPASGTVDWPVYHRDPARTGLDPDFAPVGGSLTKRWATTLDGAVYGQPLVVGGRVIAATEADSVYALDPTDGAVIWRQHLGEPVPLSALPCGNINPLGITSTPAYDPGTNSVFVVAELSGPSPSHVLFALDPADGAVRWSRGLDSGDGDPAAHQQRGALALGNGYVYVGIGGLFGDCGQYRGKVLGVPVNGNGPTLSYEVPTVARGAVWSSAGPVLDAAGNVYVSVGNGSSTDTYDGSDSVLELSPTLELLSFFAPSRWAQDNATDADLGSMSPVLVPGGWVFIAGKSGVGYVLRQDSLGGIGGEASSSELCAGWGGAAQDGATLYVPCSSGLVQVNVASDGSLRVGWHASSHANGPPVIGGGAVWSLDLGAGELYALDPADGSVLAHVGVGPVPHFASPTLSGDLVFVGTTTGVVAITSR